jgi:uncharacterized SAM-binding protein YcdF (DUF218 family)
MGEEKRAETGRAARPRLATRRGAQRPADGETRPATTPLEAEGAEESVTALVSHMLSSGGVALVLVVGALWMWRRPVSSRARRWLIAGALAYAALSCYAISYASGRLLVAGFRPLTRADVPAGPTAIVVLGSGSVVARDWDDARLPVLDRVSADRVLEAIRVFKMTDAAWVIASGGLVRPGDFDEPNGRTMRDALVRSGVPAARLLVETQSRNTHDEAVIVGDMLRSLEVQHVILVTSEIHMRRSLGTFRAEGIQAVPAIARQGAASISLIAWIIPTEGGLNLASDVWHEILGLGYYVVRGWYR